MDEAYELELAREGGGAVAEDQWIAWDEALALAPDLAAKKRLVHGAVGGAMPDFSFRAAMCSLLDVQELLDARSQEADAKADALLQRERPALETAARELRGKGHWRKAHRVEHRCAVLELEIATRRGQPDEKIKELNQAVASALGLTLSDSAPAYFDVDPLDKPPAKTELTDDDISTEKKVADAMRLLQYHTDEDDFKRAVRSELKEMGDYAREIFFMSVASSVASPTKSIFGGVFGNKAAWNSSVSSINLSSAQRWWVFELFLDKFVFDYTDVDGYLDVIVQDLKRAEGAKRRFGSRQAHSRLSLSQLQLLLEQERELFRDDVAFATRLVHLMIAAHQMDQQSELDMREHVKRTTKLAAFDGYLKALSSFSPSVNSLRAWILHVQLRELQFGESMEMLKQKFVEYVALPRFGADFTNADYIRQARSEELVVFEDLLNNSHFTSHPTQPSSLLRVDVVSCTLGDHRVNAAADEKLIKSVLYVLWASDQMSDKDEQSIRTYLSLDFVERQKAECMVISGRGDLSVWKPKLPRKGDELSEWSSTTEISFCESNSSYFAPEEELGVYVNVRNVKSLTVQVYEVRTIDYYTRVRSHVRGDICLDGLLPNEEHKIDLSHLLPWQKARVPVKITPSATGRRGVFVVEVFEKDTTCRALIRKGFLRHIQRVTARGIEFSVLDERGTVLSDASLLLMNLKTGGSKAQSPRQYAPIDDSGVIVVPFRQAGESLADKFGIVFRHGDFGFFHRGFDYTDARYSLCAQMYIDQEQLRPGEEATLLVRPILSIGTVVTHVISAKVLTNIKATIKFSSVNRESSAAVGHKIVQTFDSVDRIVAGACSFTIPLDADTATVEISARVSETSGVQSVDANELPSITSTESFAVQRVTKFEETFTPLFVRREVAKAAEGSSVYAYFIVVLGHNGERVRGKSMSIEVQLTQLKTPKSFVLESDQNGEIKLGKLDFAEEVTASFSGNYAGANSWRWELPNLRTFTPQMFNCSVDTQIRIPFPVAFSGYIQGWLSSGLVSLHQVFDSADKVDEPVLDPVGGDIALSCVKNINGQAVGVSFRVARAGQYILRVKPLDVMYAVTACKLQRSAPTSGSRGLLIQRKQVLLATPARPMIIMGYTLERSPTDGTSTLSIQLDEAAPRSTQVWVVLKQSLDQTRARLSSVFKPGSWNESRGNAILGNIAFVSTLFENEYLKKRKIGDEYTYILQRRAFVKSNPDSLLLLGGSSLPRPTLIQTPTVLDESDMEELVLRDGEKVSGFRSGDALASEAYDSMCHERAYLKGGGGGTALLAPSTSSLSFLARSSAVLVGSAVDANGVVRVRLSDAALFREACHQTLELVIMAFDLENGHVTSLESQINQAPGARDLVPQRRDVRLVPEEALDSEVPSMQLQRHEVLPAGESRTLPRSFSSKYALYESMASAMDLWAALCSDAHVPDLVEKLKAWPNMKQHAKLVFYRKNASDDLNFFLYKKDRQFFNDHVKPFVSAKLCPSLIDLYVLEDAAAITQRYAQPALFQRLSMIEKLLVAQRAGSSEVMQAMCQHAVDVIEGAGNVVGHELSRVFDTVLSQGAVKPEPATEATESVEEFARCSAPPPPPAPGGLSFGSAQPQMMMRMRSSARSAAPVAMMYESAALAMGSTSMSASLPSRKKKAASLANASSEEEASALDEDDDDDDSDFGVESFSSGDEAFETKEEEGTAEDGEKHARKMEALKRSTKPYVLPGKVRRVQEKRFFNSQKPHLDGRNLFWRDYAKHLMRGAASAADHSSSRFLSSHFPEALRSFTEGIFALSVLDLEAGDPVPTTIRLVSGGHRVQLDAVADVVLYHQGIGPGTVGKEPNSVLILKQRLVSHADLASATSSDFADIRPAREFLVNRVYSCVVSVSNISSSCLKGVNLLQQIPRGAIPVTSESFYTKNEVIEIAPHDTQVLSCNFYFPEVGSFVQYPAHASLNGEVIAWASTDEAFTKPIKVVLKATAVDLTSWTDVAARGSLDDVITFLTTKQSLASLDLTALAWRCQEKRFYEALVRYLRKRWVFNESIWKYALLHNDTVGIRETASAKDEFVRSLGAGVHTSIVQLGEMYHQERFDASFSFDHTEFGPLLSRRVHHIAGKATSSSSSISASDVVSASEGDAPARVLHKKAREYYRTVCHVLSLQPTLTAKQLVVVVYYLILFHRIADALKVFERVKALESSEMRDTNAFSIAADYIDAYLDFFRASSSSSSSSGERGAASRFPVARRNVAMYTKLANERWRLRFSRLQDVLDEYDDLVAAAAKGSRASASINVSDTQAMQRVPDDHEVRLKAEVKDREIQFTSQHLGACEISFYRIDVELMFSTEPFDSFSTSASSKSSLLLVQPWKQMRVLLAQSGAATTAAATGSSPVVTTSVRLPADLAASPMLLRIREIESTRTVSSVAAPIEFTRSYFSSQLQVIVTKQAGMLQVLHDGLPVPSCYVKVYAKTGRAGNTSRMTSKAGKAQFYKDGYTDVIGKFDYTAINGDLLARVEKFSLLISHPTLGTTVEQVAPPVLALTSNEFRDREALEAVWF